MKKIILLAISLVFLSNTVLYAEYPHYLDFKYVLNKSEAGKKAQLQLKQKLDNGIKSINKKEKVIQEEKKIIEQKKVLSNEEYKKEVNELRKKVSTLQKERTKLLNSVADERAKARVQLLKNLNPIVKEFMIEKKIRMVIDKRELILADEKLDVTDEIINRLNKKIKKIKIN